MSDILIPGAYYLPIFLTIVATLTLVKILGILRMQQDTLMLGEKNSMTKAVILLLFMAIFLGGRPYTGLDAIFFADTSGYASAYIHDWSVNEYDFTDFKGDWFWSILASFLCRIGFSTTMWFTFIALCFLGCVLCSNRKLFKNNVYLAILFAVTAFGFYQDVINGIRNSLACSMAILAITLFIDGKKKNKILAVAIAFIGTGIHTASTLLCVCALASAFFLKDTRKCILIWIGCMAASLIVGDSITDIFSGLDFDDRMDKYTEWRNDKDAGIGFSHTGFRWDFVIYSAIPILLGYYVIVKRKICDYKYSILLNTYILANAFWLLVIRAKFSNRFAMISWALYSIVMAYPLIKYKIYNNQQNKIAFALMLFLMFEFYMLLK
jgi:hypothetical protein